MLSQEQQKEFITFFEKHTGNVISDTYCGGVYEKVVHWIRALKGILSLFNDSLKLTEDETCEKCALHLCLIWENYIEHYKKQQYVKNVILCLLFLLRRRKYNHDFLREQSPAYEKIEKLCSESHEEYGNLTDILSNFLKGKGTIESLAQIKDSILDNES